MITVICQTLFQLTSRRFTGRPMWHLRRWICDHLTEQLRPNVSPHFWASYDMESCVGAAARFLWSASIIHSNPGHFAETKTSLRTPIGNEVGVYRLESVVQHRWFLCWCQYRLGVNKNEHSQTKQNIRIKWNLPCAFSRQGVGSIDRTDNPVLKRLDRRKMTLLKLIKDADVYGPKPQSMVSMLFGVLR